MLPKSPVSLYVPLFVASRGSFVWEKDAGPVRVVAGIAEADTMVAERHTFN